MLPVVVGNRAIGQVMGHGLPKYFASEEVKRILSDALRQEHYDAYFLCFFLWNTGARISEALSVKVEDIDLKGRALRMRTLKRKGHVRVIPLQNTFIGEVALWIHEHGLRRGDKLFSISRKTAYNHVRGACHFAGCSDERAHPHTFRHSFAVNCLIQANPVPITVLREWLGHRDITKTLIYTQILAQDTRVFMEGLQF